MSERRLRLVARLSEGHRHHARASFDMQNEGEGFRVHRHDHEAARAHPWSKCSAAEGRLRPFCAPLSWLGLPALATGAPLSLLAILDRVGGPFLRGTGRIGDSAHRVEGDGDGVEPGGLLGPSLFSRLLFIDSQEHLLGIVGP